MSKPIIEVQQLEFAWESGQTPVLSIASFKVFEQERVFIKGPSGCGKSTLLSLLGGVMLPQSGEIRILDQSLIGLSRGGRDHFRADHIGFVFQMFHLVPYLDLLGNVLLAAPGKKLGQAQRQRAAALLDELGLAKRATHRPGELSAGERQRLAVARALLNRPKLILADEPTGNLDPENAAEVIRHLAEFHRAGGTVVLVTHGSAADTQADRILRLEQGRLLAN